MKIAIVGGGNIGAALARRLLSQGIAEPEHLTLIERDARSCDELRRELGCYVSTGYYHSISEADAIIFAIKPQDLDESASALAQVLKKETLFISLMAGISVATLEAILPAQKRFVRCMPNLPFVVGEGITVAYFSPECSNQDVTLVEQLLRVCGAILVVNDEDLIDAATAVSGSGPGYLAYIFDAYVRAAESVGFSTAHARELVMKTLSGTVALSRDAGLSFPEITTRVASKGGTTEMALNILSERAVGAAVIDAVNAAFARAKELNQK